MGSTDAMAFVAAVKERFDDPQSVLADSVEWVGGGVGPDGIALVSYREFADGPVLGRRYVVAEFATLFEPPCSVAELAGIAFANDITDPTGSGEVLPVDWARGLVPDGTVVEWIGESWDEA